MFVSKDVYSYHLNATASTSGAKILTICKDLQKNIKFDNTFQVNIFASKFKVITDLLKIGI